MLRPFNVVFTLIRMGASIILFPLIHVLLRSGEVYAK